MPPSGKSCVPSVRSMDILHVNFKVYKKVKQKYFPIFRLFGAMEIHGHVKTEIMLDLKSALYYAVSVQIIVIFIIFVNNIFCQVKIGRDPKSSFMSH